MTTAAATPTITFHDGHTIPQLGLGVWQIPDHETIEVVETGLRAGYRHLDTAAVYENERGVGEGLRRSGVAREEVFITTKLWNTDHHRGDARRAFEASCERLGLETVDLYLIHWPSPTRGQYVEAWETLGELHREGRVRSIGVSNFGAMELERIIDATGVVPVLNQVELHPWFQQAELRAEHDRLGIRTEAWSPLGQGRGVLEDPDVVAIARRRACTPAQAVLAWHLAVGNVVIPKSANAGRMAENFGSLDVRLEADDLEAFAQLDRGASGRIGPDPATANF